MDALYRNVRQAVRALCRTPGLAATIVLTLALGIGASSAVFAVVDAVVLRALAFPDPDRLVLLTQREAGSNEPGIAPVRLEDWNAASETLESITGYSTEDASDTTGELPERVRKAEVAPRFLETFGVAPALGRGFTAEEYRPGGPRAALISDRYWRSRLGADPNVLGRTLEISGQSYAIVGVMPASFPFPAADVDVWNPDWSPSAIAQNAQRLLVWYTGIGRLKPGVTLAQARADLELVQARLAAEFPQSDAMISPNLEPLKDVVVAGASTALWTLFGAVSLLLLIACTNIASLLLARAARREQDIAVRFSLGASRRAVGAALLAEAAVLAAAGAAAGLAVAAAGVAALKALAPSMPRLAEASVDLRMLAFTAAAAVAVALLCGVWPAVRGARALDALARSGRGQVASAHRALWLLVGAQAALSIVLLGGAGLLLRSFDALTRVDAGFEPRNVLAFRISADWGESGDYNAVVRRLNGTIDELAAMRGIDAVATAAWLPGLGAENAVEIEVLQGGAAAERIVAEQRIVSPEYFAALRIPLLAGELCTRPTDLTGTTEVMVNRAFAERYYPGRSVLGLQIAGQTADRIVGVVGDARERGFASAPVPTVYSCFSAPTVFPWFLVRTAGDPDGAVASIRARVRELEPLRAMYEIAPLEQRIGTSFAQNRLLLVLLGAFGVAALALVCLGVHGTLSYVVSLRTREVGVRVALGALAGQIVGHLMGSALAVVGIACVAGVALAFGFGRLLSSALYGVGPSDPAVLAGVALIVVAVASAAALLPAARAARIDPMRALREE